MRAWPVQLVNRGWSDGLSRYCVASAVPSLLDSTLFHSYFPALTCEAFPCRRFAAGAIARPTFFCGPRGCDTDSLSPVRHSTRFSTTTQASAAPFAAAHAAASDAGRAFHPVWLWRGGFGRGLLFLLAS